MKAYRKVYKIAINKPERKYPLGRPRHRSYKKVLIECSTGDWIKLSQDSEEGSFVKANEFSDSIKVEEFFD
jgi:hypothetical protein